MNHLAEKIQSNFKERFSRAPSLYFSPGRINLIGEHIDYNDGYVMPGAIDKGIYFAVALNQTQNINFYAVEIEHRNKGCKKEGWLEKLCVGSGERIYFIAKRCSGL